MKILTGNISAWAKLPPPCTAKYNNKDIR